MRLCGRIRSLMAQSSRQRTRQRCNAQSKPTAHAPPSARLMAQPSQRGAYHAHPPASSRGLPMPIIVLMSSFVNCEQFNIRLTDYGHRDPKPPASLPRFPPARPRPKPRPPPCARAIRQAPRAHKCSARMACLIARAHPHTARGRCLPPVRGVRQQ